MPRKKILLPWKKRFWPRKNALLLPRRKTLLRCFIFLFAASSLLAFWVSGLLYPSEKTEKPAQMDRTERNTAEFSKTIEIPVYRTRTKAVDYLPLEEYLIGVVAAEMPAEFELEALKAQAITARTYIIRRAVEGDFSDVPAGAWVKDSVQHQAYLDDGQLRRAWGEAYEAKREKIARAVSETAGKVMTYQGRPIQATFFSTSNGFTENSEEYFGDYYPYLRSVPSPWDKESPKFKKTVAIPLRTFEQKLGVKVSGLGEASRWSKVLEKTTGGRIARIKVGKKVFTGREIRELLGLNSSCFSWEVDGQDLVITTYGYGHGVGMSQWGANGLAKEGKTAEAILKYYYQGVEIEDYRKWLRN